MVAMVTAMSCPLTGRSTEPALLLMARPWKAVSFSLATIIRVRRSAASRAASRAASPSVRTSTVSAFVSRAAAMPFASAFTAPSFSAMSARPELSALGRRAAFLRRAVGALSTRIAFFSAMVGIPYNGYENFEELRRPEIFGAPQPGYFTRLGSSII